MFDLGWLGTFAGEEVLPYSGLPSFSTRANSLRKEFAPVGASSFL